MPGMLWESTAFMPRYQKFESISLQQTVRVSPRPGRCRSKNARFRAGVRRCGRQRHAVLVEIAQTGAVISVRRYSSTAADVIGQRQPRPSPKLAGRVNFSSKAEQDVLLVPGQRQT